MSTLSQLTDRVISYLQGFSRDQEEKTWTVSAITDDALTFRVNDPKFISAGMCEIEDELLWVSRVDNSTGDVTIAPFGRGYQGTTAVAHGENSCILNSPKFPKRQIHQSINDAIRGVYPDLYVSTSVEFPAVAARTTYELPADTDLVHSVTTRTIGPSQRWATLQRWQYNPHADPESFDTGKSIDIYQEPIPGQTIRVMYMKPPSVFEDSATEFAAATGLAASSEDCIVYSACFRLAGLVEMPRLQISSIEQQLRATQVPPGASQHASRHFLQLYQISLQSERERLIRANPTSTHFRYI
jgi:hypothetical protein